jgi:hypothetical protein
MATVYPRVALIKVLHLEIAESLGPDEAVRALARLTTEPVGTR